MSFFSPKTWKQRIVEFPGRRRLDDTSSADVYDVSRAEGTVIQEGDGFTASNMNDLEQRIYSAVNEIVEIEKVINGNQADLYSPDETYTAGRLVINNNALWKAKQDIDVAEAWTPDHWDPTTLAAELSALNPSMDQSDQFIYINCNGFDTLDAIISGFSDPPKPNEVGTGSVGALENTNLKELLSSPGIGNYTPVTIKPLGYYGFQVVATALYASSARIGYLYKNGNDAARWTGWL